MDSRENAPHSRHRSTTRGHAAGTLVAVGAAWPWRTRHADSAKEEGHVNTRVRCTAIAALGIFGLMAAVQNPIAAQGGKKRVKATLNGYQEDPSVSTTGHGTFSAVIDDEAETIQYVLTYEGLESTPTLFAHIHFGSHDHAGGVAAFLCGGSTKPAPCPPIGGTVTGTIVPADVVGPAGQGIEPGAFSELVAAIRVGHAYANVHTQRWPAGEIRGQINNENQREETK
jgi:hypothetical protein